MEEMLNEALAQLQLSQEQMTKFNRQVKFNITRKDGKLIYSATGNHPMAVLECFKVFEEEVKKRKLK